MSVRPSTPPLAAAAAGLLGMPPPVMVTEGAVKPKPASATSMLETTPGEMLAWAVAFAVGVTPGDVIVTVGGLM